MDPERTKKRLQKKLEKRRNKLQDPGDASGSTESTESTESVDFMKMLGEVNKMFKTNPNMIQKVSKCVNNIMENKELMETLVSKANLDMDNDDQTLQNKELVEALILKANEIGTDTGNSTESSDQTAQTLHSNALAEQLAALSNESKQ